MLKYPLPLQYCLKYLKISFAVIMAKTVAYTDKLLN